VVAVVGDDATDCVRRLGEAVNVVPVSVDPDDPPALVPRGAARGRAGGVIPVTDPDAATRTLPRLGAGAWWPDLDGLLGGIEQVVPDELTPGQPSSAGDSARMA
jgi:hypothetical protein